MWFLRTVHVTMPKLYFSWSNKSLFKSALPVSPTPLSFSFLCPVATLHPSICLSPSPSANPLLTFPIHQWGEGKPNFFHSFCTLANFFSCPVQSQLEHYLVNILAIKLWLQKQKIARRNINNLRYADDTTIMAESEEELKSLLMKVKQESEKVGLKLNMQKTKIMASGPITSWEIDEETGNSVRLYFWGFQNYCRWWLQPWN